MNISFAPFTSVQAGLPTSLRRQVKRKQTLKT